MNDEMISKLIEEKQLKPYLTFLKLARDCLATNPIVSYWSLFYVVEKCIEAQQKNEVKDTNLTNTLNSLITTLETEKKVRGKEDDMFNETKSKKFLDDYGNQLLLKGDREVEIGVSWKLAKKLYIAAYTTFQLLVLFGDQSELNSQRIKYCKFKAVALDKEIKESAAQNDAKLNSVSDEKTNGFSGVQEKDENTGNKNINNSFKNKHEDHPQVSLVEEFDLAELLSRMNMNDSFNGKAVLYCKNAIKAICEGQIETAINCLKEAIHRLEKKDAV